MECTLAALVACFSWSGLYVDTGIQVQDAGVYSVYQSDSSALVVADGQQKLSSTHSAESYHSARNPYGKFGIGYELRFTSISVRLDATHISSLGTESDRGINSLSLNVRWHPFR